MGRKADHQLSWQDITEYGRDQRGKIEPKAWEQEIGQLTVRIKLSDMRTLGGLTWALFCEALNMFQVDLNTTQPAAAKLRAMELVRARAAALALAADKLR